MKACFMVDLSASALCRRQLVVRLLDGDGQIVRRLTLFIQIAHILVLRFVPASWFFLFRIAHILVLRFVLARKILVLTLDYYIVTGSCLYTCREVCDVRQGRQLFALSV
jgi:hypothetical protein